MSSKGEWPRDELGGRDLGSPRFPTQNGMMGDRLLRNNYSMKAGDKFQGTTPRTLRVRKSTLPAINMGNGVKGVSTVSQAQIKREASKKKMIDMNRFAGSIVQNDYHQLVPVS